MNIILVGYRCSGKTAVGRLLADRLVRDFIDTDTLIEDTEGSSIEDMVDNKGWGHFRQAERTAVNKVSGMDYLIIATGGGVVMNEENIKDLKRNGIIIWLKADVKKIKERMDKDQNSGQVRPSLTGDDPAAEIRKVLDMRNPLYQKLSDFAVDTDILTVSQVADLIISRIDKTWSADQADSTGLNSSGPGPGFSGS